MSHEPSKHDLILIEDAIFSGAKIEAIKMYRESAGCDLAEAKAYIDGVERDLRANFPERFAPKTSGAWLIAIILWVSAVAMLVIGWAVPELWIVAYAAIPDALLAIVVTVFAVRKK
jgi:hypothetical protein